MFRPWQIWLAFGVCLAVVIAAVGWLSVRALEADNAEAEARHQAAVEENAQLALWRMDSAMAPLVAQESARPYFTYESFYSVGRPALATKGKPTLEERLPSPLLVECPPEVLLHFQIGPQDRFTSPRVPPAELRNRAIPRYLSKANAERAAQLLDRVRTLIRPQELWASLPSLDASATGLNVAVANTSNPNTTNPNNSIANSAPVESSQSQTNRVASAQQPSPQQAAPQSQAQSEQAMVQPNAPANEFQARSQLAQNFQAYANSNSYTGGTTINGGTLNVSPPRAEDATVLSPAGGGQA